MVHWAQTLKEAGCGEILLTSVDQEGTRKGFDTELVCAVNEAVMRPVIVSGGCGTLEHVGKLLDLTKPAAIAVASVLHYESYSVEELTDFINLKKEA